jgi:multicomponent Na+:H+ antiporter subunit G
MVEWISLVLIGAGLLFFLAGTLGVLRFPDALSRLHALTKADNLGLGLVVLGLMGLADNGWVVLKLLLIWLLVLASSAIFSHLIGMRCHQDACTDAVKTE